ncbi:MAG: thiol protease/hemagglutinin PrtT [Bacteroidales bacterium]|nr:thiol protease/hemagglutinin PrtT [Bacteroidales bacterium]
MKKYLLSLIILLLGWYSASAHSVSPEKAKQVAINFLKSEASTHHADKVELLRIYTASIQQYTNPQILEDTPLIYLFAENNQNFVLVAADDVSYPVLGYGSNNNIEVEYPYAFQKWIEDYKRQLAYAIEEGLEQQEDAAQSWELLLSGNYHPVSKAVNPLLTTIWNQTPYVNDLCPGGSVTGCVATAMAQVMKYWNHPAQGTGMHSFTHPQYGTLSANFGATTYQWADMPNAVNSPNNAVATLMYHCGVSVEMNYSPQSSGAYVIALDDPACSENALKDYFGYSQNLQGVKRDNGYSTAQWTNLIKSELDGGRPVLYAGFGSGGGHAFVCDGYNNSNYFHFNWGWGGAFDGYFLIDALNPGGTGTGGGTGGYNSGHQALTGVQPESGGGGSDSDLVLYAPVTISPNPINIGNAFSIYTDIANIGNSTFQGDFAAMVFDSQYNPIDFVQTLQGYTMDPQTHFTNGLTFNTSGMNNLLPGNYYLGILCRLTGQDWNIVGNGDYNNFVSLTVNNSNQIELYCAMEVSSGNQIIQNQPFTVYVEIANYGSSTFYGNLDLSLYHSDGSFAETIQTFSNVSLEAGYYYEVTFASNGTNLAPGNYYLAVQHAATGAGWELTGSSYYPNPITTIIQAAGLSADIYEPNDHTSTANPLNITWANNTTVITTDGSNNHSGLDYDCYKISLPTNYSYTITGRAHDSYNSSNGQVYTNDVIWSYNTGLGWHGSYDDVMTSPLVMPQGGEVYFLVSPYFLGSTGTYLLQINIDRTALGTAENMANQSLLLYPNPAYNVIHIKNLSQKTLNDAAIFDVKGQLIDLELLKIRPGETQQLDINRLQSGVYTLKMQHQKDGATYTFIKK